MLISVPNNQHCAENAWISVVLPVLVQGRKLFIIWKWNRITACCYSCRPCIVWFVDYMLKMAFCVMLKLRMCIMSLDEIGLSSQMNIWLVCKWLFRSPCGLKVMYKYCVFEDVDGVTIKLEPIVRVNAHK
jgi:hypothetical protein